MVSSAFEHSIPEKLLSTEETTIEGISAAKALQIANVHGILIYNQSLDLKVRDELRERVYSGTGIISSLYLKPDGLTADKCGQGAIQSVSGVRWRNICRQGLGGRGELDADFVDSPRLFHVSARADHVEVFGDALVAGWMTAAIHKKGKAKQCGQDKPIAAVVLSEYGNGKSVYLAFDLGRAITEANYDEAVALVRGAVARIHNPDSACVHPYDMQAFEVRLNAMGGNLQVRVQQNCHPCSSYTIPWENYGSRSFHGRAPSFRKLADKGSRNRYAHGPHKMRHSDQNMPGRRIF